MQFIPVFYSPHLVAVNYSISPSAGKPELAVKSWQALGIPIDLREPNPATVDEPSLAHDRAFVEKVLACRTNNGFGGYQYDFHAVLEIHDNTLRVCWDVYSNNKGD